ncbi:UNVERIFIED_ORG: hypothetical protein J2Y81_002101 [Paraburkholderia sediminicola]|nr:hypothetical protein [Paraburkholderia sediminicola]
MMENNEQQPITAEDLAEMQEFANTDGKSCIDWDYWVCKRPMLTVAQAVRLMAALDPETFNGSLALKEREPAGASKIHASRLQSLAISYEMESASPAAWLAWADSIDEPVHYGFRAAVDRKHREMPFNAGGIADGLSNNILSTPGGVATNSTTSNVPPVVPVTDGGTPATDRKGDVAHSSGGVANIAPIPAEKPLSRQRYQEQAVLETIRQLGFVPKDLPEPKPGMPGVKSMVRKKVSFSDAVFKKAWERLLDAGEIAYA